MQNRVIYNILNIVTVFAVTMFFSCSNNFEAVKKVGVSENEPIGIAENINLKYTDSGKVSAILVSPKMLDYTNRDFPFNEFPEGITLDVFDDKTGNKSVVVSDYAIVYGKTDLIDLQGNVVITMHDGNILKTEQLYFDSANKWLFTNDFVEYVENNGTSIKGYGLDSNKDFTKVLMYEMHDSFMVLEE